MIDWTQVVTVQDRRAAALQAAHARIQTWRDEQEKKDITFEHAGRTWDGGKVTRDRLQPVLALAELPSGFFWTDHGNADVPVTLADLQSLNTAHEAALVAEGFRIHAAQRQMKAAIESMTLQQLQAFKPDQPA